ncbi:MAG TPA: hypothetical protein VFD84_14405 [Candidatus Binatia bacterium]|nr:hypothetical protein [Candidatus Binatia bacterium]
MPAGSGKFAWAGSTDASGVPTCDTAHIDDPTRCQPCQPVASCFNACDACEVCVGKPEPEPACGGEQPCAAGAQACGLAGQPPCPPGRACVTGCCQPAP